MKLGMSVMTLEVISPSFLDLFNETLSSTQDYYEWWFQNDVEVAVVYFKILV